MEDIKIRYRASCLTNEGDFHSHNFNNVKEAEDYILEEAVKGIKKAIITDRTFSPPKKIHIYNKEDFE